MKRLIVGLSMFAALTSLGGVPQKEIRVTPASMKSHGFDVSLSATAFVKHQGVQGRSYSFVIRSTAHDLTSVTPSVRRADGKTLFWAELSCVQKKDKLIGTVIMSSAHLEHTSLILTRDTGKSLNLYVFAVTDWKESPEQEGGHVRK